MADLPYLGDHLLPPGAEVLNHQVGLSSPELGTWEALPWLLFMWKLMLASISE